MSRLVVGVLLFLSCAPFAHGQEVVQDEVDFVLAKVLEVVSEEIKEIPGLNTTAQYQVLRIEITEGMRAGNVVELENNYVSLNEGDRLYVRHTVEGLDGRETFAVAEAYRLPVLYALAGLFLLVLFVFGGWQGFRGLIALIASLFFISYLLLPGILAGYPPLVVSMVAASCIIVLGSYVTHGLNRTTSAAVIGMLATVVVTGLLAYGAVYFGKLSGFSGDEVTYLNFSTGGSVDLVGLLLGGIIIGLLGVLYDAAIGQAVAVEELLRAGDHSRAHVYRRALRIGREHIGALVNTLAIAYVGAALPLILLLKLSSSVPLATTINQELFAQEIIRTLAGSIGLILAVPITTAVAVYLLYGRVPRGGEATGHSHTH